MYSVFTKSEIQDVNHRLIALYDKDKRETRFIALFSFAELSDSDGLCINDQYGKRYILFPNGEIEETTLQS